MKFRKKQ